MAIKYHVSITKTAELDTEDIWTYIAADNPDQADRFIAELLRQASTLERFPRRCPFAPENKLMGTDYRHLLYGEYRTIFKISDKKVHVLRIIHGARLLDSPSFGTLP